MNPNQAINETIDVSGDNELSGYNQNVVGCDGDAAVSLQQSNNPMNISEATDEVFLPPKIKNCSTNKQ